MTCKFQSLYFSDDAYVVHCKQCGRYQIAFISTILTLNECDFQALYNLVKDKCENADDSLSPHCKSFIIQTPANGIYILLTKSEGLRLLEILEEADNEYKAQSLICLFNS